MKLEKGTKIRIVKYGHQILGKDGKYIDKMPQYVKKTGVIDQVGPYGYMIRFDGEKGTIGWFDEAQTEAI